MKWLEVIMMQVAEQNREIVHQKVAGLISEIGPNSGIERTLLFRHAMTENGLNIHIYWNSDQVEPWGSAAGLSLCSVLAEYGLVSHAVWIEVR